MASEADRNFADLLSLRCPARAHELTGVLTEARRNELRGLIQANSAAAAKELVSRISARIASAAGPMPDDLKSLPRVFRKGGVARRAPGFAL